MGQNDKSNLQSGRTNKKNKITLTILDDTLQNKDIFQNRNVTFKVEKIMQAKEQIFFLIHGFMRF